MTPAGSLERFVRATRKSGLIDELQLQRVLTALDIDNPEASAGSVADSLVRCGLLSRWQADMLLEDKYKGFFIDHFVLIEHRGSSADSARYLVRHTATGRLLLLKLLNAKSSWWSQHQLDYEIEDL